MDAAAVEGQLIVVDGHALVTAGDTLVHVVPPVVGAVVEVGVGAVLAVGRAKRALRNRGAVAVPVSRLGHRLGRPLEG